MELKKCNWCNFIKPITEFRKRNEVGKSLTRGECSECTKKRQRERYILNKEKILKKNKQYEDANKEKRLIYLREYYYKNKEKKDKQRKENYLKKSDTIKEKRKKYYYNNKEVCINQVSNYYKNNKEKIRERQRNVYKIKKNTDLKYKITKLLRGRISAAMKLSGVRKKTKTMDLVGCSISFLKEYIENKFKDGMNWGNHGIYGWHIDHIIPCSLFDLTKEEEQRKCFHYTNLQPLWSVDNLKKSNKIIASE